MIGINNSRNKAKVKDELQYRVKLFRFVVVKRVLVLEHRANIIFQSEIN